MREQIATSQPSGIAVDPVDTVDHMTAIKYIKEMWIAFYLMQAKAPMPHGAPQHNLAMACK